MFNSIKYSYNYSGTNLGLWKYYKDEPKNPITDSDSFKFKSRFSVNTNERGVINAEIAVKLKYISNFWRVLEMLSIDCEINLIVTWPANHVISGVDRVTAFAIADTKLYVLVVTFPSNDNAKLLQQLNSSFQRTINWNKYQSKVTISSKTLI